MKGEGLLAKSFELAAKVAEIAGIPGAPLGEVLIKEAVQKLRDTAVYPWLLTQAGFCDDFVALMRLDLEQITRELMKRLAEDWRAMTTGGASISPKRAQALVFVDSTEWIELGYAASTHADLVGRWLRDLCIEADSVLFVLAGQNRLDWDRIDSSWKKQLEQHNLDGFCEADARAYLAQRDITSPTWVTAMLDVSSEGGGRYHPLSLAWAADIGTDGNPAEFTLSGNRWNWLGVQFLKSLRTDGERNAIMQLAVPPRFDSDAIRWVYGEERLERAAEERLCTYSFVEPLSLTPSGSWWRMRPQLRRSFAEGVDKASLANVRRKWNDYWVNRAAATESEEMALDCHGLAWALRWELDSESAFDEWAQRV
ncbi:MAG: hypothetical protein JNN08_15730, partial [Bryobacterales bacterium]|nr:hypothetical protein [Bryobacterales bacterium]